jgi:predicted Zn finger-like uncharacterized protein
MKWVERDALDRGRESMIAGCPKCSARYRVDLEQIGEKGAKLRCTKCSAVFLVRAPKTARPAAPEPVVEAPRPKRKEVAPVAKAPASHPPKAPSVDVDSSELVLIADPSEERGKQTATAIENWGLIPLLVHDGVEAMLEIQRRMPNVVVLDAALPKMFGFQVCEVVKRNESLRHMRVVLVGAIHHQDRYRRDPSDLYGADVYLEQPDLPDGLMPLLRDAGMAVSDLPATPPASAAREMLSNEEPVPAPANTPAAMDFGEPFDEPLEFETAPPAESEPVPESPPAPELGLKEAAADEDPELAAERERAERLARIAVSEMLLYQPEKFDQAIRDGNVEAVLDLEIQEARALIRQRISEEVRAEKDFILVELERVAEERGASS